MNKDHVKELEMVLLKNKTTIGEEFINRIDISFTYFSYQNFESFLKWIKQSPEPFAIRIVGDNYSFEVTGQSIDDTLELIEKIKRRT